MFRRTFLPSAAALMAFEAVARHQNVSRAADELALTQSAVSRRLSQLESQLGLVLFERVRQRLVLTDTGRIYAAQVSACLQQLSEATQTLMAQSNTGQTLNLAALPTLASRWLIPHLGKFARRHPDVTVNFAARSEPFDFAGTAFDGAIHFGGPHWAGANCEFLMNEEVIAVCSEDFQRRYAIHQPEDLARVVLLQQSTRPTQWTQWFEQMDVACTNALRGPSYEHFSMMTQAAIAGLGAALLPRILIETELVNGSLVSVSKTHLLTNQAYYFVYPQERAQHPALRAFRAWIQELATQPIAST
jgi:LysR family glycine cleavage system transcriptional activator